MKKVLLSLMLIAISVSAMAQQSIQLRSANKAECVRSDMRSLKASFSFSTIEAQDYESERGTFSWLSLPNTVIGGNEGDPQIPAVSELIAVPFGAIPSIRVTSYSTTDYNLAEYGMHRLMPRQPDLRKDQRPEDVPFVYNEAAYQTRGLRSEPVVRVSVDGTMRGVQVGRMSIEPVSYDPVNNKIRVFNDIEVEVSFDGADARATEDMLVKTYSPYFDVLYKQLFNGRAVRDVYDEHPDLWTAPVKMLVIANRMFESCIQDWVAWKTLKGIYVDVNYTDNIGTSADAIKSFIQNKYAQDAPTFLMIMGDKDQVAPSVTSASSTSCVSDLYYSSVDGDQFVDMYHSRLSATTAAEMTAILNKGLEYEQYTMPDPSYLNNVLLIAGEDSGWGVTVGRPTIWYATNYYYNTEHGFSNVYEFSHGTYTNCYSYLSSGVGFANYTAHGSQTSWAGPSFSVSDVNNLTNTHKYFLAIGNCCQSGDWGYGTCFGEALTRAENKGAYAYIGSCPNTVWLNDYYFGVGPTSRADGTMPSMEETGTGIYDAIWMDDVYNTVNSILYVGNLAGNAAQALGYDMHRDPLYYWQAYHVLGDGSIMPYRVQPTANNVSHMAILPIGMSTYEVSAVPGSYVAISKDGVLHGTALVGQNGTAQVPITPVTSGGNVTICVTASQRIPYIATVPAAALEGAYISVDGYTPTETHVGDNTNLSITFKNVGTSATTGTTNITLTTDDPNVTLNNRTGSFGTLAPEATTTVSGFSFSINSGVADGTSVTIHYSAVNNGETYEGNLVFTANEAVLEYQNLTWNGGFVPGETLTLTAKFKNTGHYQATNAVARMTSSSSYININATPVNVGTIAVGQEVSCQFTATITANCPETAQIPVTFTMTADGGLTAQGNETLKNACNVVFDLVDSYGDGWNGANLVVSFDDGTPDQSLTIQSGGSSASYTLEIGNGTHVTLTWSSGSYDGECSFTVSYEGDLLIFSQTSRPSAGVLYEFDCNCAAASQTFMVNVSSSNTAQGTVSGGGEYSYGQTCTVTATPVEGFYFMNWTKNGEVVSTDASYSFVVNSDVNLVANFTSGLNVTVIADPANAGTVSGGGEYGYGANCTVTATPAEGYFFTGWTQDGETVQGGATYSFTVYNDVNLVAHFAEGNMIGDGGTTTDQYLPSYSFYNYSLTQQIYTAEELGEAGSITSIAFFNGGSEKTRTYDFYLKATTKSTFSGSTDWVVVTAADKVFSGSVTMTAGGWTFINFDTPYQYDGTSNLVLVSDDNTGTYSSGMLCRVFEAASQAIRIYSDGTNYDPFAPTSYEGTVMSVKNQILLTKEVTSSTDTYIVTISANPEEDGTVAFGGRGGRDELVFDFEDGTSQGWTTLKGDNGTSPNNWMHVTEYTPRDYTSGHGHSSDGFMLSESYISAEDEGAGTPVYPDNYLVSPQIQLGGSINFWVTGGKEEYSAEHFALLVSTTGNTNISDFTQIQEWTIDVNASKTGNTRSFQNNIWYEYTVDLSAFSGMGYVAFHHFDCYDEWLLCLDDITISNETSSGGSSSISATFNSGASCTVIATPNSGYTFLNWTENGTAVSSDASYTFTVNRDRELVANFAEGYIIGDGGDETNTYLPSYNYYNYALSQQIYTSEELGAEGVITSIAFYNGGAEKTRTYDFYMVATDKESFSSNTDWVAVSEADRVFSGIVTMVADDWTYITLNPSFYYDGTSNVILVADDNSGVYTGSPHMACRVFEATNQALYAYNDNINFNPLDPPTSSSNYNAVLSVKNQLQFTKEAMSDCMSPSHLIATEVGPDFAVLSWIEHGTATQWVVAYAASNGDEYFVTTDENNPFTLGAPYLSPATEYTVRVRPICDNDEFHWSDTITFTTLEACPIPENLEVNDVTDVAATMTWSGYNGSYNIQLGTFAFGHSENFTYGIPTDWTNDTVHPWTIVDGYIQSGNAGIAGSSSSISVTVTFPDDGHIEFDAECMGEGTSTYWDHCDFFIDDTIKLNIGAGVLGWNHYSFEVTAGEHTFTWSYTKDGSVNPDGDHFALDNVLVSAGEVIWNDSLSVENMEYTVTGLTPVTTYGVRVQGVCDDTVTEWSEPVFFTTAQTTTITQTIELTSGWNWFGLYLDVEDPIEALHMLEEALGENGLRIESNNYGTEYLGDGEWIGDLDEVGVTNYQMYLIEVSEDCTIELQGMPAHLDNYEIIIYPGYNWIAFPFSEEMSIADVFADFEAEEEDQIEGNDGIVYYYGGWFGSFENLVPGQGYMYFSNSAEPKTLVFSVAKAKPSGK